MSRKFLPFVFIILSIGLIGCGTGNNVDGNLGEDPNITDETKQGDENLDEMLQSTYESKQTDDFKVSIHVENVEKDVQVYATITYVGEEDQIDIYHGGSIFFFNVHQIDGNFEHIGGMDQPLLTTTLAKGEAHEVEFTYPSIASLHPGTYEFEAIANISLDADNVVGTKMEIPVSVIVEIK